MYVIIYLTLQKKTILIMNILIAISSVPETTSKINFSLESGTLNNCGVQFVINPYDEFCLTKAIQLKEKHQLQITIVSVGTNIIDPVIRKALALGADEAIRIDIHPKNSSLVAKEIAEIAKEKKYDLFFFGKESIDYNGEIVHSMVSGILNFPIVNNCVGVEIENQKVNLIRENDNDKEFLSVNFPVIIVGKKGLVEEKDLKIPNMRGIIKARNKSLKIKMSQFTDNRIQILNFENPASRNLKIIDDKNISELIDLIKSVKCNFTNFKI